MSSRRRLARSPSPDSGKGLKNKELHRLLKLSNGNFILGNKNVKSGSNLEYIDNRNDNNNPNNVVTSSVSKLLAKTRSRNKSKSRRSLNRSAIDNESMVSQGSSKVSESKIEHNRGRVASQQKSKRRSKSRLRSSTSEDNNSKRSQNKSRSKSRKKAISSAASACDSIPITAESLEDLDVNIAAAKSLALKKTLSCCQSSVGGQSMHSNRSLGRSRSAMKSRRDRYNNDDCSSIDCDSVLSNQLSVISNLEDLNELDATVLSASENRERVKYSRRSASSSRAHSRNRGGHSDYKRSSHRRKRSSNESISGSVCTTESMSVKEILSELRSVASNSSSQRAGRSVGHKRSSRSTCGGDTPNTLKDLLKQSRDVLKEASDSRLLRSQSLTSSATLKVPSSLSARSRSDSSHMYGIDGDVKDLYNIKTDIIAEAEHSFLDSLAESFQPMNKSGDLKTNNDNNHATSKRSSIKIGWGNDTPSLSSPISEDRKRISLKTVSGLNRVEWPDHNQDLFSETFEIESFDKEDPFSSGFNDAVVEPSKVRESTIKEKSSADDPTSTSVAKTIALNKIQDVASSKNNPVVPFTMSPNIKQSLNNKATSNDNPTVQEDDNRKNDLNEEVFERFSPTFNTWTANTKSDSRKDESTKATNTKNVKNIDPFAMGSPFSEWNSSEPVSGDAFSSFFDENQMIDADETFGTQVGTEDSLNVTVLSYSINENMEDFFADMKLDDFDVKKSDIRDDVNTDEVVNTINSFIDVPSEKKREQSGSTGKIEQKTLTLTDDRDITKNTGGFLFGTPVPFNESFESSRSSTKKVAKEHKKKSSNIFNATSFKTKFEESVFDNDAAFEAEEKTKFMMGFASDFSNDDFASSWDKGENITFNVDDDNGFGIDKKLSFGSIAEEQESFSNELSFDPFIPKSNEFQTTLSPEDPFFTSNSETKKSATDFFSKSDVFDDSFVNSQQFDNETFTDATPKFKSSFEWNSGSNNQVTSFEPWANETDEWTTPNFDKKTGSPVRNDVIAGGSSCVGFLMDTTESPTSVIPSGGIRI